MGHKSMLRAFLLGLSTTAIFLGAALGPSASASILDETLTNDVNRSSVHLRCKLQDMQNAEFASYSEVTIRTEFGDDSPSAVVLDGRRQEVPTVSLQDFSEHENLNMRIFELFDYEKRTLVNLIVVYQKVGRKITAEAVLTGNGQDNPVVRAADMKCTYVGPMAING